MSVNRGDSKEMPEVLTEDPHDTPATPIVQSMADQLSESTMSSQVTPHYDLRPRIGRITSSMS